MKKAWLFLLTLSLIIPLVGCKKQVLSSVFTVQDEIPAVYTEAAPKYTITFALPQDAAEQDVTSDKNKALFEAKDGSYSIMTQIIPKGNADEVIKDMTGYDRSRLLVLQTERFSMPEYRFSWSAGGENGLLLYYGAVLADEDACYTIQFSSGENSEEDCAEIREDVLSTFGLHFAEGF